LRKRQQRPIALGTYDLERNGIGLLIQWVAQLRCPLSSVRPTAILSLSLLPFRFGELNGTA